MKKWTPSKRKRASLQAKKRYANTAEEVRNGWLAKSRTAYLSKYPERAALITKTKEQIASGEIAPEPCRVCEADEAKPEYDYERLAFVGWSHFKCRKVVAR